MIAAIRFGHEAMQPVLAIQEELAKKVGKPKLEIVSPTVDQELAKKTSDFLEEKMQEIFSISLKQERNKAKKDLKEELTQNFCPLGKEDPNLGLVTHLFEEEERQWVRQMILREKKRIDARSLKDIRPISCEAGLLPRTHGSALFTRGETQALAVTTLGSSDDQQLIDALGESYYKRFMLHYNFPPFSTGEVKFLRSPGRREVGHGALAERSIVPMLPSEEDFPYTTRVGNHGIERFFFDGFGLRRQFSLDGCRCSFAVAGGGHCHGIN